MPRNILERARGATAVLSLRHTGMSHLSPALAANPAKSPGKEAPRPPLESLNNKTCGSQGPSLIPSCPIFISGTKRLPAVRLVVTVGGSVASRFPSLCLLFFHRASCVTGKTRQTQGLSSSPGVNQHARLHANETRGLCTRHNSGIIHKANWVTFDEGHC